MVSPAHARTLLVKGCLPENSVVIAGLRVVPQAPVAALPEGLKVEGPLDCSDNPALTTVHARVRIEGSLLLRRNKSLQTVGSDLFVALDCAMTDCSALKSIDDNLYVGRDLDLSGCPAAILLPLVGQIGRNLVLPDGYDVACISKTFTVGGKIMTDKSLRADPQSPTKKRFRAPSWAESRGALRKHR